MPLVRTAVTAGDHIDWITTSPEAIRLTDSLKSFHSARNWPAFLASIRWRSSGRSPSLVMLPLSGYLYLPLASTTIAASMMPIDGMFRIAALPLNSGFSSSAQLSDRALDQVGPDAQRVGVVDGRDQRHELRGRLGRELLALLALQVHHLLGRRALVAHLLAGHFALGEQRGDLVGVLDLRLVSMPFRLPVGTIFLSEKYSVSIRSKLLGAVTARLVTSSVVTATYWI
jgi:hypothetical protein